MYTSDSAGFNCAIDSQFTQSWLSAGEIGYATLKIVYDTNGLPYYPKVMHFVAEGKDSLGNFTRKELEIVLYFTLWNTLEIWDKFDFEELPRRWDQPDSGAAEPPRIFIDKSSLPHATALPIDSIQSDYDYDMQYTERVENLPYSILMRAPNLDSLAAWHIKDSIDFFNHFPHLRAAGNDRFFGTVSGQITFNKIDDHNLLKTCNLSGIRINLVYQKPLSGKSIAATAITKEDGTYNLKFDFKSYFNGIFGLVGFNLELVSRNEDFDISVKRRKLDRNKNYIVSEAIPGIFDNSNNGSVIHHSFTLSEVEKAPFQALHYASNAYNFMKVKNSIANMSNGLDIFLYNKDKGASHYYPITKTIYLETGDDKRESVVYHEFGHHVMNVL